MDKKKLIEYYKKYAKINGFRLNPDEKIVNALVDKLIKNGEKYGANYCPCRRITGDKEEDKKNICPCIYGKEEVERQDYCLCRLFVKNSTSF